MNVNGANLRNSVLQNWQIFKLYTDEASMDEGIVFQSIDDLEIWDDIPKPTHLEEEPNLPTKFELLQNYPNPFNPKTNIKFSTASHDFIRLEIYDTLGQLLYTLVNEELPAGDYEVEFDATKLSSGVYFYQLKNKSFVQAKKMLLLK